MFLQRAYERIKYEFPNSLALLEIARISTLLGSNLGLICGFISNTLDGKRLDYLMEMQDAENPIFSKELREFMRPEQPVNHNDLRHNLVTIRLIIYLTLECTVTLGKNERKLNSSATICTSQKVTPAGQTIIA